MYTHADNCGADPKLTRYHSRIPSYYVAIGMAIFWLQTRAKDHHSGEQYH